MPDSLVSVLVNLSFELGLGSKDVCLESLSDLRFLFGDYFNLVVSVIDNLLKLIDFSVEQVKLVVMSVSQQREFRFLNSIQFVSQIDEVILCVSLSFKNFVFKILILFFD